MIGAGGGVIAGRRDSSVPTGTTAPAVSAHLTSSRDGWRAAVTGSATMGGGEGVPVQRTWRGEEGVWGGRGGCVTVVATAPQEVPQPRVGGVVGGGGPGASSARRGVGLLPRAIAWPRQTRAAGGTLWDGKETRGREAASASPLLSPSPYVVAPIPPSPTPSLNPSPTNRQRASPVPTPPHSSSATRPSCRSNTICLRSTGTSRWPKPTPAPRSRCSAVFNTNTPQLPPSR